MLHLELHESWSDQNFLWFKRVPCDSLPELMRRKTGTTNWPDESIIAKGGSHVVCFLGAETRKAGMQIITRGPPYISKRWHVFWPDHQSFVEELSDAIVETPRPKVTPPPLLVYSGPNALKNWNKKGPPMGTLTYPNICHTQLIYCIHLAVTFQTGDKAVSDEWTGGKGMLWAYPGGPGRIRKYDTQ